MYPNERVLMKEVIRMSERGKKLWFRSCIAFPVLLVHLFLLGFADATYERVRTGINIVLEERSSG